MKLLVLFAAATCARDIQEVEDTLLVELNLIDEQLIELRKLRQELNLALPTVTNETGNFQRISHSNGLILVSADISRTQEQLNAKLVSRNGPDPFLPSFVFTGSAPVITFKSYFPSIARKLTIQSAAGVACSIRQLRVHFFYESEPIFVSKLFDLPGTIQATQFDLEVDVIYDTIKFDILRNWGDDLKTCFHNFDLQAF
jgi:hypothetical protein